MPRATCAIETLDTGAGAHAAARPHGTGYRLVWDFAEGGKHVHAAAIGQCRRLADEAALADTRRPNDTDHAAAPVDCLIEETGDGVELPGAPDQLRVATPALIAGRGRSGGAPGPDESAPFDVHHLRFCQQTPPSTSRAVDSLSITPPAGATDSIRWAIPTCSPTAVYPKAPEPISPAIT